MPDTKPHPIRGGMRPHEKIPMSADDVMTCAPGASGEDAVAVLQELRLLQTKLHTSDLVDVLRGINKAIPIEEDSDHSSLTNAEIAALRDAGSFVETDDILPVEDRPSVRTALTEQQLVARAYTTEQVARLLGVTTGRVRQRSSEGSLFTVTGARRGLRFPRFQFTDTGELPGWGRVSRVLPESANPVAVEYFLMHSHPDLANGDLSPAEWLATGGDVEPVVALAEHAFTIR